MSFAPLRSAAPLANRIPAEWARTRTTRSSPCACNMQASDLRDERNEEQLERAAAYAGSCFGGVRRRRPRCASEKRGEERRAG